MKLVVRIKNKNEIKHLAEIGANVFLLDTNDLTTKVIFPLDKSQLISINQTINNLGKETYVLLNKMIHESDVALVKSWLLVFKDIDIDGIVINDFTIYVLAKELGIEDKIIYQPGTMNTNSFDVSYLENKIKGMTLSKEITLEEIIEMMKASNNIEYSLLGHGFIDMFYSKRKLISNYFIHKNLVGRKVKYNDHFVIEEKTRENTFYPIYEDEMGTHIFRDKKLQSFDEVRKLKNQLSDLFIERIFMGDEEYYHSISAYLNVEAEKSFIEMYGDAYHQGFYYTPTEKTKGERHVD